MAEKNLQSLLIELGACEEAVEWSKGKTLTEAWMECDQAEWMLWFVARMARTDGWPNQKAIVLVACLCVERVLPIFEKKYPNDSRARQAIEAARAWTRGELDIAEVRKAGMAAIEAAADTADAISYADYAAHAVAEAVDAITAAAHVAGPFATDAADIFAIYIASAVGYAARADFEQKLADIVRANLVIPDTLKEGRK